jgi:hypothetical protein
VKYVLLLLALTGCIYSKPEVGQCYRRENKLLKVEKVGEYSVILSHFDGHGVTRYLVPIKDLQTAFQRMDCFGVEDEAK